MGMSLFQTQNSVNGIQEKLNMVNQIKQVLNNRDVNSVANLLYQRNPQFAKFVNDCKGMNINQICEKYNLDVSQVNQMIGRK